MNTEFIVARDLPDAWFSCLDRILDIGNIYTVDRGSYEGQQRLEFDYITIHIKYPGVRPLLPDIPSYLGIPNPVKEGYLEQYLPYLMTSEKQPGEFYTYGERLEDQIQKTIDMYKHQGFGTNQACMSVSMPSDINLNDPPCVLPETYIITEGGVKFIKDVVVGEKVLGHDGKFNEVEKIYKSFYSGDLYRVNKYKNFDTHVTSNHPLWGVKHVKKCPYDKKLTCKLNCSKQYSVYGKQGKKCPKVYNNYSLDWTDVQNCNNFYVPSININYDKSGSAYMCDSFRLYGYFLADGNLLRPDSKEEGLTFAINRNSTAIINDIETIFNNVYNKRVTKYYNKNVCRMYIYSKKLCRDFKRMFYDVPENFEKGKGNGKYTCYYKIFPVEFLKYQKNLQKELVKGFSLGDGYVLKNGNTSMYVTSRRLAVLFIAMLNNLYPLHTGYKKRCYGISHIDGRAIISRKEGYEFIYNESNNSVYHKPVLVYENDSKQIFNCKKLDIEKSIAYHGYVYNLEVKNSHSYIADGYLPLHNCLRQIDTRISDGKLHFIVYFRSWDLWNGAPANLGAIQLLKEYMGSEIGVGDGEIIASSKGLHLYDYTWELSKLRTGKHTIKNLCERG